MRSRFRHSSGGFTLIEMLVVLALIGILSLISVPAFVNMRNENVFRADLRTITHDLRMVRQYAITNAVQTRVEMDTGNQAAKNYYFFVSTDNGANWSPLQIAGSHGVNPAVAGNIKVLDGSVWFQSMAGLPDVDSNGKLDILYDPSGAMRVATGSLNGTVVMRCLWKKVAYDTFTLTLSGSGNLNSAGSHT
jgi:prepilin-type N-terminal cleavage/methylation domain-containing protein